MSAIKAHHHDTIEATQRSQPKDRPILFSAPMVRAILQGRKTQTRRILNPQPKWIESEYTGGHWYLKGYSGGQNVYGGTFEPDRYAKIQYGSWFPRSGCPYGQPGDHLYVRETWALNGHWDSWKLNEFTDFPPAGSIYYKADLSEGQDKDDLYGYVGRWRPSIHMPRAASRITLQITHIRAERLQDITADDARAEGITDPGTLAIGDYLSLWDTIHGPGAWKKNPWVWVIEFTPLPAGSKD